MDALASECCRLFFFFLSAFDDEVVAAVFVCTPTDCSWVRGKPSAEK